MNEIFVTKPYLPPMEEYTALLSRVWDSRQLTNMGPMHQELEKRLADYLGVPYCLAFCNGHTALEMAIRAMNLSGEVITTPFTFASTTHAITRCGLTPVFCDIRADNYCMDADRIEPLITEKTTAILPVHVYGQLCDVEKIGQLAEKYHLKVIYDAAHAFGETLNGIGIGSFGDASMFSFHATKPFHTVEGGALTFRDQGFGLRAYQEKNFGFMGEDNVCAAGGNGKMTEVHAAMGLCNLNHMREITEGRKRVTERYREHLRGKKGLRLLEPQRNVEENFAYFPILVDEKAFGRTRDTVYNELARQGIHARRYFYPLTSDFACYQYLKGRGETPVAAYAAAHVLTLPLYDSLSDEDVDRICNVLLN